MRIKAIFGLTAWAALATSLGAQAQLHLPGLHNPSLSPGRAGAARKNATPADTYTYGAVPAAPPAEETPAATDPPWSAADDRTQGSLRSRLKRSLGFD